MEIGTSNSLLSFGKELRPAVQATGKDRQADSARAGLDNVEISNFGRGISRLNDIIYAVPDVRDLRVKETLFAIESGTYENVKAEQVAEKMMKSDFLDEILSLGI